MGALLLTGAAGSVLALPLAGWVVNRIGTAGTVRLGGTTASVAAVLVAAGLDWESWPLTAVGLFFFGAAVGLWDVAQNLEGADVERRLGRTIIPRFHAAFSGGAFAGALVGAGLAGLGVGLVAHLWGLAVVAVLTTWVVSRYFLPHAMPEDADLRQSGRGRLAAWREPRTLLIGVVVLGAALTEGSAYDWLAKATVDGLGTSEAAGAVMFAAFVAAMTAFRMLGGSLVDRFGRAELLRLSMGAAFVGLLLFVVAPNVWLAGIGAVLWGAGAAMGFPMGMSAAADEPFHAAARVSVVSTTGYTAFLVGPPLLGYAGDLVGIRNALLLTGVVMLMSILTAGAVRERPEVVQSEAG